MIATCPSCKARYRLEAARLKGGRGRLKCARCSEVFTVTTEAEESAAAPPPAALEQPAAVRNLLRASRGGSAGISVAVVGCEAGPLRESLVRVLARAGLRTLTTDDGPTCLDMARRTRPKLIVAASYLPGLTGPELADAVVATPMLAGTRVVLLAAAGTEAPPPGAVDATAVLNSTEAAQQLGELVPELLAKIAVEHELDEVELGRLERQARVAARDLLLYHPLAGDRREIEAEAAETRAWMAAQWPRCPQRARDAFDAELDRAST